MELHPLPAFSDNCIWTLNDGARAVVVDPGESQGVLAWLAHRGLVLEAIWVTHHHHDHTGGVAALQAATGASVVAPAREWDHPGARRVTGGDAVRALDTDWQVLDVAGHTAGHIAFWADGLKLDPSHPHMGMGPQALLFCGDTLFSGGCGRLFEGTAAQMHASLQQLSALPDPCLVCCAHEYTLSNLRFARAVEPDNPELAAYILHCQGLRDAGIPTLPAVLATERRVNPFLRTSEPQVHAAMAARRPGLLTQTDVFATLREWKNTFQ